MSLRAWTIPFALATLPALAAAQGGCPISGISTLDYAPSGVPTGYPALQLGWDAPTCGLKIDVVEDPCCIIGNQYLVEHFLIYGDAPLNPSVATPLGGHDLLVFPVDVLGPLPGKSSILSVPPDPALVGRTFYFQGVAEFIVTVSLPIVPFFVLTHGVIGTLL